MSDESGTSEWDERVAADLLAEAWHENHNPEDPKGGIHYPGFSGDPEWHKDAGRWLKRYIQRHGRPARWPWTHQDFDYLAFGSEPASVGERNSRPA